MANFLIKEASDEALHLRKLLQKYKADINKENLSKEESLNHIENMVKVASIIYAKLEFINKI
jgi:Na+/phosphate symporter